MFRFFLLLLPVLLLSCSKTADTPAPPVPTASFTATNLTNGEIKFSNASTNATTYKWDFGDATPTVTDASPGHVYALNGKYNVVLTATGAGGSASSTQVVTVSNAPDPKPTADFTFSEAAGVVSFVSVVSNTTSVVWDFGDATATSNEANPKHTYTKNQIYTVKLTATGKGGTVTVSKSVEVKAAPVVDPKAIYISKITVTQLGYYSKTTGVYRVFIRRKDNAGYVDIFKSTDSYPLIDLDKRYEYKDGLPFKLNYPDRVHAIKFANNAPGYFADYGDTLESIIFFNADQPILTYLRSKAFPNKVTITDITGFGYNATVEVEFTYDY
jgi:PKD repeat protein